MIVYRYLTEDELNNILESNVDKLGAMYNSHNSNTFNYVPKSKYLHFFKHPEDMAHIRKLKIARIFEGAEKVSNYYYCSFNIPKLVLFFAAGKGFYNSSGYDAEYVSAREYAVLVKNFNPEWLHGYVKDNIKDEFNEKNFLEKINSGVREELQQTTEVETNTQTKPKGKIK